VHTKRRNCLEQQKLNALVFVKSNLHLEMRQNVREEKKNIYDLMLLFDTESDDEWILQRKILSFQKMFHRWIYFNLLPLKRELQTRKKRGICLN